VTPKIVTGVAAAISFPPHLGSVAIARQWIRTQLATWDDELLVDAELLASEIVTNAIRHGRGQIAIALSPHSGYQRFEVYDEGSDTEPRITPGVPDGLAEGGWGLQLLGLLASSWATEVTSDGNRVVWYELPCSATKTAPASVASAVPGP